MPPSPADHPPPAAAADQLRRMLARGPLRAAPGSEAAEAAEAAGAAPVDLSDRALKDQTDVARGELNRIVKDYLDGDAALHALADDLAARGRVAMETLRAADAAEQFASTPRLLDDLEAIVRTDGSRPSFLVRNGTVDLASSPVGTWRDYILADETPLRAALACVGRIDNAGTPRSVHVGTGFLVAPDLILTNRHVLQDVADEEAGGWAFKPGAFIDFGREFRGRESVHPRRLAKVVYAGKDRIDMFGPVVHGRLDLALVALEPADPPPPVTPLAVEAATDWAEADGPQVFIVGYPARPDPDLYPPTLLEQLFRTTFRRKRLAPGVTTAPLAPTAAGWTMTHDATTLGGNSGSVVLVAGRSTVAAGLHYGGRRGSGGENWGHVLGLALDTPDAKGRTLRDAFAEYKVKLVDHFEAAGPAPADDLSDGG